MKLIIYTDNYGQQHLYALASTRKRDRYENRVVAACDNA